MSFDISSARINSDEVLDELVLQSLDKIIGTPHQLIGHDLPFTSSHALLAIDNHQHPALIVVDQHDGGRALLQGFRALEDMEKNRACVFKLYPKLFGNSQHALRSDDIHLYIMAPTPPPGGGYLRRTFTRLHIRTFQPLLINGEPGLLIDDPPPPPRQQQGGDEAHFRSGSGSLTAEESAFFDNLNVPG
jgi:hypothetical protein